LRSIRTVIPCPCQFPAESAGRSRNDSRCSDEIGTGRIAVLFILSERLHLMSSHLRRRGAPRAHLVGWARGA
jgi:hypothetical protein